MSAASDSLIARMTPAPSAYRAEIITALVDGLIADGVWDKLDFLHVLAAHDQQSSLLNWKGDYWNATQVGSPLFVANQGWRSTGAGVYLQTGYNPSVQTKYLVDDDGNRLIDDEGNYILAENFIQQNAGSFGVWCATNLGENFSLAGFYDGTRGITINPRTAGNVMDARMNSGPGGSSSAASVTDSVGLYTVVRTSSSAFLGYRNDALHYTASIGTSGIVNGGLRYGGTTNASSSTGRIVGAGFGGEVLSATEVAAIYARLAAYMVAVAAVPGAVSATLASVTLAANGSGGTREGAAAATLADAVPTAVGQVVVSGILGNADTLTDTAGEVLTDTAGEPLLGSVGDAVVLGALTASGAGGSETLADAVVVVLQDLTLSATSATQNTGRVGPDLLTDSNGEVLTDTLGVPLLTAPGEDAVLAGVVPTAVGGVEVKGSLGFSTSYQTVEVQTSPGVYAPVEVQTSPGVYAPLDVLATVPAVLAGVTVVAAGSVSLTEIRGELAQSYVYDNEGQIVTDENGDPVWDGPSSGFAISSQVQISATGSAQQNSLTATLAPVQALATGALAAAAQAEATLADVVCASAATAESRLALVATLENLQPEAAGTLAGSGALDALLGDAAASATATADVVGALGAALQDVSLSSESALEASGLTDSVLQDVVSEDATGGAEVLAESDSVLQDLTHTAAATAEVRGAGGALLGFVVSDAAGAVPGAGALAAPLGPAALVAEGTLGTDGQAALELQGVVAEAVAAAEVAGAADAVLGSLTADAAGVVRTSGGSGVVRIRGRARGSGIIGRASGRVVVGGR